VPLSIRVQQSALPRPLTTRTGPPVPGAAPLAQREALLPWMIRMMASSDIP